MEVIIAVVGFLGAGKTTLLKYLIDHVTHHGWDPFIILNDYENAQMDAQQFTQQIKLNNIKALSGSCICCSGIVELRNLINRIPERKNGITLIEANGTSDAGSLMEFLGVGLNDRYLPPIQIAVVDVKNWHKRGEHNDLEANQIQISSLIVLTHVEHTYNNRKKRVIKHIKELNPQADIITMDALNVTLLTKLLPSINICKALDHHKAHWASCSVDLPVLPNSSCIDIICANLPKSILRVKGCVKIEGVNNYTYFERTPDGNVSIRPFNGEPITGTKLLTIGQGSAPQVLVEAISRSLNTWNATSKEH